MERGLINKGGKQKVLWGTAALLASLSMWSDPVRGQVVSTEDFEKFSDGDITLQGDPAWPFGQDLVLLNGIGTVEDSPGGNDEHGKVLMKNSSSETHWFPQLGNENPDDDTGFLDNILRIEFELWVTTDASRSFLLNAGSGPIDTIYTAWAVAGPDTINRSQPGGGWSSSPAIYDIPVDRWMNVEAILDQANDTFDLFVDDTLIFDDVGVRGPSEMLDRISWSSSGNNVIYMDNMCIAIGMEGECPKGPPPGVLLGDANNDGQVTGADIIAVQRNFSIVYSFDSRCNGLGLGDANDDCRVTGADVVLIYQNFRNTSSGFSIPEPEGLALFGVGCLVASCRRYWGVRF